MYSVIYLRILKYDDINSTEVLIQKQAQYKKVSLNSILFLYLFFDLKNIFLNI